MFRPLSKAILSSVLVLICAGCPVDQTTIERRTVEVVVTDPETGEAVADADVRVAMGNYPFRTAEDDAQYLDKYEEDGGQTDDSGQASLRLSGVTLWRGESYSDLPNTIRGEPLLFCLEDERGSDTLWVDAEPGESAAGQFFTVTVISVR